MTRRPENALKLGKPQSSEKPEDETISSGIREKLPMLTSQMKFLDARKTSEEAIDHIKKRRSDAMRLIVLCRANRKQLGNGYNAEIKKADTIVLLSEIIELLFQRASGREDTEAVIKIGAAARELDVKIQRNALLRMEPYPDGEPGEAVAQSMIEKARELQEAVETALGPIPKKLGTKFPEFIF